MLTVMLLFFFVLTLLMLFGGDWIHKEHMNTKQKPLTVKSSRAEFFMLITKCLPHLI